ncbi:MAG: helix-turn-helix domain-containing protein [Rhodanobacter sp.]
MVAARVLWLDYCCASQRQGLFQVAHACSDAHRITWPAQVLSTVHAFAPNAVCIEYDYPDQARLRAIPLVRRAYPALPVLMLTEYHSEALAVWAYRHRVWDYRVKPITDDVLSRLLQKLLDFACHTSPHGWLAGELPSDLIAPSGHLRKPLVAAPRTASATAFVSEHYGEVIRLETMARLCHLSESEFSRVFHHEHDVSFRRFLLNYRIAMARDFLAEPDVSVSQVAYAVGFNDLSHFGRTFRRLVGEPATCYRQRVRTTGQDPTPPIDRTRKKPPF